MKRHLLATLLVLLGAGSARADETKKIYSNSYLGKPPPELTAPKQDWLNTSGKALSLEKLRGQVVWLEFSFLK